MVISDALARLGVDCVDILYLHAPDHKTSLFETMSELAKLKEEGKFKELGLSNYSSWLTCEVVNIAKQNGFPVPTVYRGMYSEKVIMKLLDLFAKFLATTFQSIFLSINECDLKLYLYNEDFAKK